jgi:hypothetical protein
MSTNLHDLATPALLVDVELLRRNIADMAAYAERNRLALRPHAKTHKSPAVAELQRAAGAVGLTVATVSEAEVFAAAGHADLFIKEGADQVLERVGVQDGVSADQHDHGILAALKEEVDGRGLALTLGLFDELDAGIAAAELVDDGRGAVGAAAHHHDNFLDGAVLETLVEQAGQAVAHVGGFVDGHHTQAAVDFPV